MKPAYSTRKMQVFLLPPPMTAMTCWLNYLSWQFIHLFSMKKIFLLCSVFCMVTVLSVAQQPRVELSESFEEPEGGWNKVLQLTNGNTFFFHFNKDKGIEVWVYDKKRRKSSNLVISGKLWEIRKLPETTIEGFYEIGGQPVIFMHQTIDRTPSLFRLILNENTGAVETEELISSLPKYKTGSGWAMAYGGVSAMDFYVEKDPNSDCYAVVNFNSFSSESGERIEVVHYSGEKGNHKVLNRAFYDVPGGNFKYVDFIAMAVDRQAAYICTYGYHGKWSSKDARLIISKLALTDQNFVHRQLEFSEDFRATKGIMLYNPGTNLLQLLSLTELTTKSNILTGTSTTRMLTLMNYIDPQTLTIISSKPLAAQMVSEHLTRQLGKESYYYGVPQQMVLNKDNTTTVLMEEMQRIVQRNASTGAVVSAKTNLGSIGISELNDRGIEEDGHVILKLQVSAGLFYPMYMAQKSKGLWSYRRSGFRGMHNNAFLSFDYVNTDKGRYVLFNDYPENFVKEEGKRKRKPVTTISGSNTVCYKMQHGRPESFFLFGSPGKGQARFCYVESSHYLADKKTYATLLMQRNGREKKAAIAWVQFD